MSELTAARRYARALFQLAGEKKITAAVGQELRLLTGPELSQPLSLLHSPLMRRQEKESLLNALAGELKLSECTANFCLLLVRAGRSRLLPLAERQYRRLQDEAAGQVRGLLTSAAPLEAGARQRLCRALEAQLQRAVLLEEATDPQLLAGVRVRIGGRIFDNSLQRKLELIREAFAQL